MSNTSSAHQPKFINEVDPLLNVSPLIKLYSNCLVHVADIHCVLQVSSLHENPIILSRTSRILSSTSLSYQRSFAGIRSPRCLLTIASLFFPLNYHPAPLLNYIIPTSYNLIKDTPAIPTLNFSRIFPQSFIIISNSLNKSIASYLKDVRKSDFTNDHSLIFALRLNQDFKNCLRIVGEVVQKAFGNFVFDCSTFPSCREEMDRATTAVAKFFQAAWWFDGHGKHLGDGHHPFERGLSVGVEGAMDSFILGPQSQRFRNTTKQQNRPYFKEIDGRVRTTPVEIIPVGRPSVVKFVTTAGVFTPKSSYRIYFSPFSPTVWYSIVLCAGISVTIIFGVYHMQGSQEVEIGGLSLILELTIWILAAAIGQFKHSSVPLFSLRLRTGVIKIVVPVVFAWFILSTFLVNVYSAVFSSDATRTFQYVTNYTEFFQLPPDTQMFLLVNESYVRRYQTIKRKKGCKVALSTNFCTYLKFIPTGCNVRVTAFSMFSRRIIARTKKMATVNTKNTRKALQQSINGDKLKRKNFQEKAAFLCANTETLSRILQHSAKPMAFLISAHDFQKYWKLFEQLMQANPHIKVANNFYSDEPFFSEPPLYRFTSGLDVALKGSAVARMKILLSSGIYDLWQKWYRIKLTDGGLQHDQKRLVQENKVGPLSFDNSGTAWTFRAMAVIWLVATGIVIVEVVLKHFA